MNMTPECENEISRLLHAVTEMPPLTFTVFVEACRPQTELHFLIPVRQYIEKINNFILLMIRRYLLMMSHEDWWSAVFAYDYTSDDKDGKDLRELSSRMGSVLLRRVQNESGFDRAAFDEAMHWPSTLNLLRNVACIFRKNVETNLDVKSIMIQLRPTLHRELATFLWPFHVFSRTMSRDLPLHVVVSVIGVKTFGIHYARLLFREDLIPLPPPPQRSRQEEVADDDSIGMLMLDRDIGDWHLWMSPHRLRK